MASSVSICSNALLVLGAQPISSFTEANDRARLASNLYPDARNEFLRSHPWNVCVKRVVLSPESGAPAFDYGRKFALPADCLRVLDIGQRDEPAEDYRIEGRRVLYDGTVLRLRYLADVDEGQWDAAMVHAMKMRMAALMAYAITQSAALAQSMAEQAERAFRAAKTSDGQEDPPQSIDDSPLLQSRHGGGGW